MDQVFIFAGTTEGRRLAHILSAHDIRCTVSVATEYGSMLMPKERFVTVMQGRMSCARMEQVFAGGAFSCVVDATHPFAVKVSEEIKAACTAANLPYYRLARSAGGSRPGSPMPEEHADAAVYCDTMLEAAQYLASVPGTVLVTSGSKELHVLTDQIADHNRLYVRVLPSADSIRICDECGIPVSHIIAMQGPFSQEMNEAVLHSIKASYLLTKESGEAGGYEQKLAAAASCNVIPVVIRNPEAAGTGEQVYSFDELAERFCGTDRELVLAGKGPGDDSLMTGEVKYAVEHADVIFGSERMTAGLRYYNKKIIPLYTYRQIAAWLCSEEGRSCRNPVVLFSGDTGFYSGAADFIQHTAELAQNHMQLRVLCGIPSVLYFASRLGVSWQDCRLLSSHKISANITGNLRFYKRCFVLTAGADTVRALGKTLADAQHAGEFLAVRCTCGFQLSYPEESISVMTPREMEQVSEPGLYVVYIENPAADEESRTPGLEDSCFIRGSVPMTKRDVRTLVLSRLRLTGHTVLYDIGAGTGSVSIEAARLCPDGTVYAVEYKDDALALLQQNKRKFAAENLSVIAALAPDGLAELPPPTHVFIGGSGGHMPEILRTVLERNPAVRIVAAAVTIETLAVLSESLHTLPVDHIEYMQVSVSASECMTGSAGAAYHLMKAQNPVFIVSCTGSGRRP